MCACRVMLVLLPLALCASVKTPDVRRQNPESDLTNSVSRIRTGTNNPESGWTPVPFAHYEGILRRMPFGRPSPPPPPAQPQTSAQPAPPPIFASKLTLCAINRTPGGAVAIGFVDGSANPPHNYYLDIGETENGFTVINADFDLEFAIVEKDGTPVTLKLSTAPSLRGTCAAASMMDNNAFVVSLADIGNSRAGSKAPPSPGPVFATTMEQLLSMERSIPPGIACPPLPITEELNEDDTHAALASVIVIAANDTDEMATHKENVGRAKEELRTHLQEGGTAVSYLQVLKDRREAEIVRQKAAREAAEAQIHELAKKMSAAEVQTTLDAINQTLTDSGVATIDAPDQ